MFAKWFGGHAGGVLRSEGCRLERVNLYPRSGLWGRGKFGGGGGGENIYVKGQKQKKCFVKKIEILEISRVAKAGKTEEGRPKAAQRGRGGRFGGVSGG